MSKIESSIKLFIFLLILIVIMVCAGLYKFLDHTIEVTIKEGEFVSKSDDLDVVNDIISSVNDIQKFSTLFILTNDSEYYNEAEDIFKSTITEIDNFIDISTDTFIISNLSEISLLLTQKREVINDLSKRYIKNDPFDILHNEMKRIKIDTVSHIIPGQSVIRENVVYIDSIKRATQERKNNIFQRMSKVFKSPKKEKVVLSRSLVEKDTILNSASKKTNYSKAPVVIEKRVQVDTVLMTEKNNFLQRLSQIIIPKVATDSIIEVISYTKIESDTLVTSEQYIDVQVISLDTLEQNIDLWIDRARQEVLQHQKALENEFLVLMSTDQNINQQLSNILSLLHNKTLIDISKSNRERELILKNSSDMLLDIGMIAIFFVIFLALLIILRLNKSIKIRQELLIAKERAEQLMDSRHQMLLSVSHDIKAPLSSILANIDLSEKSTTSKQLKDRFSSMRVSVKHTVSLLTNLLEYSALEKGRLELRVNSFYPKQMYDEIISLFNPLVQQKGLNFDCFCNMQDNISVDSDVLRIKQVIINLLSNAVKYTEKGSVALKITKRTKKDGSEVLLILIKDTGSGMTSDDKDRLFKPFSRLQRNDKIEGSGFGLYVVKGLIDLLSGDIDFETKLNHGTSVLLTIPVNNVVEKSIVDAKSIAASKFSLSGNKVLLIDDDVLLLQLIEEMLVSMGLDVTACNRKESAVKFIKSKEFVDLVITDMQMDAFTGLDVLKLVRKNINTKVIVMTAYGEYNNERAIKDGFDGYLPKPFSYDDLTNLLGKSDTAKYDLNPIKEIFGNNKELINEFFTTFIDSIKSDLIIIKDSINDNDFVKTKRVCHKILPLFRQIKADSIVETLARIDICRDNNGYDNWAVELLAAVEEIKNIEKEIEATL